MWEGTSRKWSAALILETLTKLMNTTVVNMMKSVETLEAGELKLHDSIKALEGYMAFHHLLLAFIERYPLIKDIANKRIRAFISAAEHRDKEVTPDIGELIAVLSITNCPWSTFLPHYLEEVFQRNARWILAKYPNLLKLEDSISCIRIQQSWDATRVGKRLAMFQTFFLEQIANPEHLRNSPTKLQTLLHEYNSCYGRPQGNIARRLQLHSRKVLAAKGWKDYFECVRFPCPSAKNLCIWLMNSIRISKEREYHSEYSTLKYRDSHRVNPNNRDHCKRHNCLCSGSLFDIRNLKESKSSEVVAK